MKKLLFVLILVVGQSLSLPTNALQGATVRTALMPYDDPGYILRSEIQKPVQTFISNNQLTIDFRNLSTNVTITLIHTSTGKVVFSNYFETIEGTTVIDLSAVDSGEYLLHLTSSEWNFWNNHSL